jgi:hypothetical protein
MMPSYRWVGKKACCIDEIILITAVGMTEGCRRRNMFYRRRAAE